jgi:hypothetical protein
MMYGTPHSTPGSMGSPLENAESPRTPVPRERNTAGKFPSKSPSPSVSSENQGSLLARFGSWVTGALPSKSGTNVASETATDIRRKAADQEALLLSDSPVAGSPDTQQKRVSFAKPPSAQKSKQRKEPPLILRYVKERKKASELSTRPRRKRAAPVDYATMQDQKASSSRYKQEVEAVTDPDAEVIVYGYRNEEGREIPEHKLPVRARFIDGTLDSWQQRSKKDAPPTNE